VMIGVTAGLDGRLSASGELSRTIEPLSWVEELEASAGGLKAGLATAGVLRAERLLSMDEDISGGGEDVRADSMVGRGSKYIEQNQMKPQDKLSPLAVRSN
jgi:hypothetical protein